mgnify:CR=1 FL=1
MSLVLNVEILGEFKKLTSATTGAQNELQGLNSKISGFASSAKSMFASIGIGLSFALITRELKDATEAAVEDRKSAGLLADQLHKTVGANDALVASVEKSIGQLSRQAAIADDDLRPAMAQLTRVTKDTDEAQKLLKLATDVSAGSGKDLTSVVNALSKAYQGKMAALTKLGVPMSESIQNASDYSAAMSKLTKLQSDANFAIEEYGAKSKEATAAVEKVGVQQEKVNSIAAAGIDWQNDLATAFGGAAEKAANLDPYQRMQVIFGEIQEQVGVALLPILDKFSVWLASPKGEQTIQKVVDVIQKLLGWLTATVEWVAANGDWLAPLTTGILTVVGAWKAVTLAVNATKAAIGLATAAQVAFNAISGGTGGVSIPKTKVPTGSTGNILKNLGPWASLAGPIAAELLLVGSIPGSTQMTGGTKLKDLGKPLSVPNSPAIVNNVTVNNNQGTVTGSDITNLLKQFSNATGTN